MDIFRSPEAASLTVRINATGQGASDLSGLAKPHRTKPSVAIWAEARARA